jgi:hypothetical protein
MHKRHPDANPILLASILTHRSVRARRHHSRLLLRENVQLSNEAIERLLVLVVHHHQPQTCHNCWQDTVHHHQPQTCHNCWQDTVHHHQSQTCHNCWQDTVHHHQSQTCHNCWQDTLLDHPQCLLPISSALSALFHDP